MKTKRHQAILDIILNSEVYNQEGLLERLKQQGFDVTQATVSRDVKVLELSKTMTAEGKYKYTKWQGFTNDKNTSRFKSVFIEAVISVDYAINTAVIKCHVGMANAACAALDDMEFSNIVGTLAGDDTIFILLRTEEAAKKFIQTINELLGRG